MIKKIVLVLLMGLALNVSWAGIEVRQFDKPEQEVLYNKLMFELRCLVCQNENLAASNADLAKDLRDEVYKMIITKDWNELEVKQYLVDRYGDFVLYKPPLKKITWILWFGPFVLLLIGFFIITAVVRGNNKQPNKKLDDNARKEMRELLDSEDK